MFKRKKEIDLLVLSTLIFAFLLELFYFRPSVIIVILGFFVYVALILMHYDTHIQDQIKHPFSYALAELKDTNNFLERYSHAFIRGFYYRFSHFLKGYSMKKHLHFLIQPTFLYWSVFSLLFFFGNFWFDQLLILCTVAIFFMIMASVSHIYKNSFKIEDKHLHILGMTKMVVVFLAMMASYAYYHFGYVLAYEGMMLCLSATVVLLYQYAWKTGELYKKIWAWQAIFWSGLLNLGVYYLLARNSLNFFLSVTVLFSIYSICFGILKHYLKGDLNKKIVYEYLVVALVICSIIWANSFFSERVL